MFSLVFQFSHLKTVVFSVLVFVKLVFGFGLCQQ